MADENDYGNLMHNAMRSLIQDVLAEVKINGLPGEHHFFITFDTTYTSPYRVTIYIYLTGTATTC